MIRAKIEWLIGSTRRTLVLGFVLAALMALGLMITAKPAHADTFTVTNTNDSGNGSLRKAIEDANARSGADTIEFDLPDTENDNPVTGAEIISPLSALPTITGAVTIEGNSQPGASENSRSRGVA